MKKILYITGTVLLILVLIFAYYYFFFAKPVANGTQTGSTSLFSNLFPFGNTATIPVTSTSTSNDQTQPPIANGDYLEKLRLITNNPVAGAAFVQTPEGLNIRYIQRADGHIYDVSTYSASSTQISNTTIPKIHDAFFTEGGAGIVAQYVGSDGDTVQTFYVNVSSTTNVTVLPSGIDSLVASPDGNNILYINKDFNGSTGIIATPEGGSKKQIWSSAIGSVLPQYINANNILITTKPTNEANGYAYMVNAKNGAVSSVVSAYPDLSVLADPIGNNFLSYTSSNNGVMFIQTANAATQTVLTPTTFPEKCVFDPNSLTTLYCAVPTEALNSSSLDNWYMGLVSFSDNIWKYDLQNHTQTMIENLSSDADRNIDAVNLQLNSAGSLLLFQSKADGSLWSLNVSGN